MNEIPFTEIIGAFMPKPIPGYVYVVEFEDGKVKIGSTKNASERFYTLQNYYRGKKSKIVKTYISDFCIDAVEAERKAQRGLKPIEKKEVYCVSFMNAVRRVKKATGTKEHFITSSREETEKEFPFLIPTQERYYKVLEALTASAKGGIYAEKQSI